MSVDRPEWSPRITPERYQTPDVAPVGGEIKARPEDFFVEEVPLYQPCGEGEHVYLLVEKRNMNSTSMVGILARHFGVHRHAVGVAGLKDRMAVTRQHVSIHMPGRSEADIPNLDRDDLGILWMDRHTNKLRRGHLNGNRFAIKIRGVDPAAAVRAQQALAALERVGVANRFGPQRFGYLRNNHEIGRALALGAWDDMERRLLGPHPRSPEAQNRAREAYARGQFEEARDAFPPSFKTEKGVLRRLARGNETEPSIRAIDNTALGFYVSAMQSAIFNRVLDARIESDTLHTLGPGDIAFVQKNRNTFPILERHLEEDPEDPRGVPMRLAEMSISPSGPMWGVDMMRAEGDIGEIELHALEESGLTPEDLVRIGDELGEIARGARRPLRVPVRETSVEGGMDEHGMYVRCAFTLPRGSFATNVMEEIMKLGPDNALEEQPDANA